MTALLHLPNFFSLMVSVHQIVSLTISVAQLAWMARNKISPQLWRNSKQYCPCGGGNEHSWHRLPSWEVDAVCFPLHGMYFGNPEETKGPFWMPKNWSHLCLTVWKASSIGPNSFVVSREWAPPPTTCQSLSCVLHSCYSQVWTAFRKW